MYETLNKLHLNKVHDFPSCQKSVVAGKKKLAQRHDNEAEIIIRSGKEPGKKSTYYNLGAYEPLG